MVAIKEPDEASPGRSDHHQELAALAKRSRSALLRYFARRGLIREEAEDAFQEVFLRLSRHPAFASLESAEGYLFETAASVAVDHFRRARARSADRHAPYDEALHARPDLAADRIVEGRQELALVMAALREMPERTRHVVVLARLERMRHAEIARRLGISVSAVEKHLVRGLARLAERIGRAHP
ncbi:MULTISPECIES: RNA polymerase sigma factor [unclassified Brevundimonas]|uniref:RNA polymerase sigma factor n=1 Tax=unclassified Brevundimonas TaxID=2622653 RepID=UPI003F8F63E1